MILYKTQSVEDGNNKNSSTNDNNDNKQEWKALTRDLTNKYLKMMRHTQSDDRNENITNYLGDLGHALFKETAMGKLPSQEITNKDINGLKYINGLADRLMPAMQDNNTLNLLADKNNMNPITLYKKIQFIKNQDFFTKNDVDSIQKYMPNYAKANNLDIAKQFLK